MKIKQFKHINEFFETTGFQKRTDIPSFFVFRFDELPKSTALKMPPYQKDFYQISLVLNAGNAAADINNQNNNALTNTTFFLSPEHIFAWQRDGLTTGYVVYFKLELLHFINFNFKNEFSFFELSQQNFLKLSNEQAHDLAEDFEKLYKEFYMPNPFRVQIIQSFLLSLLFKYKGLSVTLANNNAVYSKKRALSFQFQNLVSNCYIKHKQVSLYAERLNISVGALNQTLKETIGKTAKEIISEKVIDEAKKLLKYAVYDISEIAYLLGFEEPTHFIRFFKKNTNLTPKAYRDAQI